MMRVETRQKIGIEPPRQRTGTMYSSESQTPWCVIVLMKYRTNIN